ncbi:MAG: hypothetical protein WBP42_03725 [Candidatus Zixiibacteriota bacterium]
MTSNLRYDFWDILKAPRIALSGKSLLAQARPLVYGYVAFMVCSYLGLLLQGQSFDFAWHTYGLFPVCGHELPRWYAHAVFVLGIVVAIGFYDYGTLTVAKLAFEELRGNYFFSRKAAAQDAFGNLLPLWVSAGLIVLLIVVLGVLQGVASLASLIPGIGEILYSILYVVPFFLWSLFLVFLAFGLVTSILTLPAIVVARGRETFGATFYIYNVIWTQPLRWLAMTAGGLVLAKLGTFVLGYFFMRALQLTNYLAIWSGGEKMQNVLTAAHNMLEPARPVWQFLTTLYPGSSIGYDFVSAGGQYSASDAESVAALIIALGLIAILILILSYGLNIVTNSQLLAFLLVSYAEDKVKLTEDASLRVPEPNEILPEKPPSDSTTA